MKQAIRSTVVLVLICAIIAIALAFTNSLTAPIIEKNQSAAANEALLEVMPNGEGFENMDVSDKTLPATVTEVYSEKNGGYVFRLTTTGYGSGLSIMVGVDASGVVTGAVCLGSTETLGYEKTYGTSFVGKNSDGVDSVDTISGATKTTAAYKNAVKDAINASIILGGGSVDLRTEEEILADNLNAVLPEGEGGFTKMFMVEVVTGIDAVYVADNGAGYVCLIGEEYVAVGADGLVITETSDETKTSIESQMPLLLASSSEELDLTQYEGLPAQLISVKKTATGNYDIVINGAGYGITGGDQYHPASGKYIEIRVSITAEGKIIDCLTLFEEETDNIGSACGEEKFYGQFVGKTETDYDSIDAISGATLTTNGYKKAIERAFNAVKIFEGGTN